MSLPFVVYVYGTVGAEKGSVSGMAGWKRVWESLVGKDDGRGSGASESSLIASRIVG